MVDDSHVVFVDSELLTESDKKMKVRSKVGTYNDIVRFEFVRLTLEPLWTESFAVDECPVGALDVFDEDLHLNGEYKLFYKGIEITHLGMLVDSRQITIVLGRDM